MRRTLRVLIIDDDEQFCSKCREKLLAQSSKTYDVAYHTSGGPGIEAAASGNFDVILVDMKMPDMDGMQVLRALKERNVPGVRIMLTGMTDLDLAVAAMKVGAADFITKPMSATELISRIEKALSAASMEKWYADRANQLPPVDRSTAGQSELLQCLQAVSRDGRHLAAVFLGDLIKADAKVARRLKSVFKERRIPVHLITGRNMVSGQDVVRYLTSNDSVVIVSSIDVNDIPSTDHSMPRLSFSDILAEAARLGLSTKVSFVNVDPDSPSLDVIFKELF
jgi:FixJ family two-component response regulator